MAHEWDVFLNCPFDNEFHNLFWAIVFTIHDCGFVARCALEVADSSDSRIHKLYGIIGQSRYGIHDLSRTELDSVSKLPRFNMPLELGIFLGAKQFDSRQSDKRCLILDVERYRYQKFCSDIAGQDIKQHNGDVATAVTVVRNWLRQWITEPGARIPGGAKMMLRYNEFTNALPLMCEAQELDTKDLPYVDHHKLLVGWLKEHQ